jgi:hypothetical protein
VTEDDVALEDARALLEAASRFVHLTAARTELEARVVLLSRRLTRDWRLTDEEAIRAAGQLAVRALVERGNGHGG